MRAGVRGRARTTDGHAGTWSILERMSKAQYSSALLPWMRVTRTYLALDDPGHVGISQPPTSSGKTLIGLSRTVEAQSDKRQVPWAPSAVGLYGGFDMGKA